MTKELSTILDEGSISSIQLGGTSDGQAVQDKNYIDTKLPIADADAHIDARLASGNVPEDGIMTGGGTDLAVNKVPNIGSLDSLGMAKWKGTWSTDITYIKNDMVIDGGWTMIANKTTTERAAPQPTGSMETSLPDVPPWVTSTFQGVIHSGHLYEFTQDGWYNGLRVWCPVLSDTTHYRIIIYDITDEDNPQVYSIEEPILKENDWTLVQLQTQVILAGTKLLILLDALDSGGDTLIQGGWTYLGDDNDAPSPFTQAAWQRDKDKTLWISQYDLDGTDRFTEMSGIIPGSTVRFAETADPTNFREYVVNATPTYTGTGAGDVNGYYTFSDVDKINQGGDNLGDAEGDPTSGDILIPIPTPTSYTEIATYWSSNPVSWANVSGYYRENGVEQSKPDSAFGVDIYFTPGAFSNDWDVVAASSGGGPATNPENISCINLTASGTVDAGQLISQGGITFPAADDPDYVDTFLRMGVGGQVVLYKAPAGDIIWEGTSMADVALANGVQSADLVTVTPDQNLTTDDGSFQFTLTMSNSQTGAFSPDTVVTLESFIDGVGTGNARQIGVPKGSSGVIYGYSAPISQNVNSGQVISVRATADTDDVTVVGSDYPTTIRLIKAPASGAGIQKVKPQIVESPVPVGPSLSRTEIENAINHSGLNIEDGETFLLWDGNYMYSVVMLGFEYFYERLSQAT